MPTLFSGLWVTCLIGGYRPRHFTPYLPQDLGSHGISARDICWIHAERRGLSHIALSHRSSFTYS
jgi:hypothetical protein